MTFNFIRDHAGTWPVRLMCRVLEVSASGYYAWRNRPESARSIANRRLLGAVRRLHAYHRGRYGSPRMHAALLASPFASLRRTIRLSSPTCSSLLEAPAVTTVPVRMLIRIR